jgi:hypothetical protein
MVLDPDLGKKDTDPGGAGSVSNVPPLAGCGLSRQSLLEVHI